MSDQDQWDRGYLADESLSVIVSEDVGACARKKD